MDEYPEYDFYNSGEACDGKDRRGEEGRNGKGVSEGGLGRTRTEAWIKAIQPDRYKENKVKMESWALDVGTQHTVSRQKATGWPENHLHVKWCQSEWILTQMKCNGFQ